MAEPTEDADDVGELADLDIKTVHAVGKAANGTTILLAKSAAAADQAGLFGADYVRDLIAKGADGEPPAPEDEKLTPAQAMALVHAASVRKASPPEVTAAKADGTDPGSPMWEGQDATAAQTLIDQILAVLPGVKALAQREGAEVGAGHMDDLADVCDLNSVADALMCAAKTLGGFAVSEHAESGGPVIKALQAPNTSAADATPTTQESTVTSPSDGAQPGAATTDTAAVAKGDAGLSETELAQYGRLALAKAAAKAAKKKAKASGAAAPDDARLIPGTQTVQAPAQGPDDVMKAQATQFVDAVSQAMAPLAKQLGELAGVVKGQGERVDTLMAGPDDRKSPLLNGAIGVPSLAQRGDGPTATPEFRAVLKAIEEIPEGPAREQAQKGVALAALKARFAPGS